MKQRCNNANNPDYYLYGERGINLCDEWKTDFEAFKSWATSNGYKEDLTIDRIDVNKGYSPTNCRWATRKEQANNRRTNVKVHVFGHDVTMKELKEMSNMSYSAIRFRIKSGVSPEDAIKRKP